jgi:hypothetical protein
VYGIVPAEPLEERIAPDLAGFQGWGPVRVGNQAAEQLQHDAYGSVILGASQMFIDERLPRMGDADLFRRLEPLGVQACRLALEPDAGPWEYRGRQRVHTHSATMCWVACDRLARIAARLGLVDRAAHWCAEAQALRDQILKRAWNERRGALTGALDHDELDASVLLLPELGLLQAGDERFVRTCAVIGRALPQWLHHALHRRGRFRPAGTAACAASSWYRRSSAVAPPGGIQGEAVRRCSGAPQQAGLLSGTSTGRASFGDSPMLLDLLDGRHRQWQPHPVAQLAHAWEPEVGRFRRVQDLSWADRSRPRDPHSSADGSRFGGQ